MGGTDMIVVRPPRDPRPARPPRSLTAAMTPASTGFLGLAVLVVMLQSSGGFAVELLGPDLLLAASGFVVTRSLLDSATAGSGRIDPLSWYREQLTLNTPLLLLVPLSVVVATATVGPFLQAGQTAGDVLANLVPSGAWWDLAASAERTDRIDPLGPLWLIALLVQFCLVWPVLLAVLHRLTDAQYERRLLTVLTPVLVTVAILAWLVGPILDRAGADLAELAMGAHARAVEWIIGAAAATAAVGMQGARRRLSRWEAPALAVVGGVVLVTMAVLASLRPTEWLRLGGPGAAAFGAAVLLLALHVPEDNPLARAVGRGLPRELGRMAFPLLLLHSLVFWLIQLAVPSARPVALLAVGGALAWVIGLVLHDGVVRRLRRARFRWPHLRVPAMVVAAVALSAVMVVASDRVAKVGHATPAVADRPGVPTVLVLGGAYAGEVATALDTPGARYTVVDGSRPGCGLISAPAEHEVANQARTTALAQLPATNPDCDSWARWWGTRIDSTRPDVVLVDLTVDAIPRPDAPVPSPCTPAFRTLFRERVAEAVRVAGLAGVNRPILLTTGHPQIPGLEVRPEADDGTRRCFNALLVEAAGSYRSLHALPVGAGLPHLPVELSTALTQLAPTG